VTPRAVFLDRDGVINRAFVRDGKPYPPSGPEELEILPGVPEALSRLSAAGFRLVVVTNQPDVARGRQSRETVGAIHTVLRNRLPIDEFRVCYHDDADCCTCRKPAAGMLLQAAADLGLDLPACFLVGDRWRDVEAGKNAGCATAFIDYGYSERRPEDPDKIVRSLPEAADWILDCVGCGHGQYSRGGDVNMLSVDRLKVKIFADGADKAGMLEMAAKPYIKGLTTNPTLMRKAGVSDYRSFAKEMIAAIPDKPISFEVFSDEFPEMERQAMEIAGWGENVYVKIPVTNTRREPSYDLLRHLSGAGVKVNVTALMTLSQVRDVTANLVGGTPCYVSVFAGRIADTGVDPVPIMAAAVKHLLPYPNAELIWASPREFLNVIQAHDIGCHIITVTNNILKKIPLIGKDLLDYSLETVKMFHEDAEKAGYRL